MVTQPEVIMTIVMTIWLWLSLLVLFSLFSWMTYWTNGPLIIYYYTPLELILCE